MLTRVTDGVYVHRSECIQSNLVVVQGRAGVLLIDPGLTNDEMVQLADDLRELDQPVVAGFSTHPDWDHVLWHACFGDVPRYGTALCAASLRTLLSQDDWEARVAEVLPPEIAGDVPTNLLGLVTGLPAGAAQIPWGGPEIRIIEHQGHAQGHAALLIAERGVLVAGDMVSDVLVPMLDVHGSDDPIGDYLHALQLFEGVADQVGFVIPGHGSVGGAGDVRARIDRDRYYVLALRDGRDCSDPRIGTSAKPGWEWVSDLHASQVHGLAQRSEPRCDGRTITAAASPPHIESAGQLMNRGLALLSPAFTPIDIMCIISGYRNHEFPPCASVRLSAPR